MKSKSRSRVFSLTILMVLAVSAFWTVPALADDSTPPPTETPTVVTPPVDEVTEVAPSMEEFAPTEVAAPLDEPALTAVPVVEETTPPQESVAEVLAQVPDGTDVVVVNSEGETLSLASQEAADVISTGDPQWCPVGVTPGSATCSFAYTSLYDLISNFMSGTALKADNATPLTPSGSGVIWIQNITFGIGGAMVLDGADGDLASIVNFSLTLKGGWTGVGTTINTGTPSTLPDSLSILNWGGDLTLSDIIITGVAVGSATNSAALDIQTTKKITLVNVDVTANTGAGTVNGAWLDDADGSALVFGDASITNSEFTDNKNIGLTVNSEGVITLANVLVTGNEAGGAYISNETAATAKAVTVITGTNEFSNNLVGDGLNIKSTGIIALKDINANQNGGAGIFIDNRFGSAVVGVTFTGTTIASENGGDGIRVYSDGAIKASNLVANSNGYVYGYGVAFDNSAATTSQAVTLTGTNQFKFNGRGGLEIMSRGAVTLNNITANNNGWSK